MNQTASRPSRSRRKLKLLAQVIPFPSKEEVADLTVARVREAAQAAGLFEVPEDTEGPPWTRIESWLSAAEFDLHRARSLIVRGLVSDAENNTLTALRMIEQAAQRLDNISKPLHAARYGKDMV